MKIKASLLRLAAIAAIIVYAGSCKEKGRFESTETDKTPPGAPTVNSWIPLYGGARFYYTLPDDEDLLSIDGEYTNAQGKTFTFTASYFKDSLDVLGLGDTLEHEIRLYGVDRAGNRSEPAKVTIKPYESAITRVLKNLVLKPGFGSFFIDWENELKQIINIYISSKYLEKGTNENRDILAVFSSNQEKERRFVNDILVEPTSPVQIGIRVEDMYGNTTELRDFGDVFLQQDEELPKTAWRLPDPNDSTITINGVKFNTGVPAFFGDYFEGRREKLFDGIIDRGQNLNFCHTGGRGRTGISKDQNMPWNIIIDMGDYYQLSRIKTVQRHSETLGRGQYYQSENVGEFRLYVFNEVTMAWDTCGPMPKPDETIPRYAQRIPVPAGKSDLQIVLQGEAGDMAYFYPDDPQFTPPARWFRFEALHAFTDNYSGTGANCTSELTLYGKKANE